MLKKIIKDRILGNSVWLMSDTILVTLLGFAFWTLNTHLFSADSVGIATALITAVELLIALSMLGMDVAIIRYLPSSKNKKLFGFAFTIGSTVSIILGIIFVLFIDFFSPTLTLIKEPIYGLLFGVFLLFSFWFRLFDAAFIAEGKSNRVVVKNLVFSIVKLILPALLVSFGAFAIFSSWMVGVIVGVIVSLRWVSSYIKINFEKKIAKKVWKFSGVNYLTNFLIIAPQTILTLMVANMLSPSHAAYFYVSWMMVLILYMVPNAVSKSLLAESSRSTSNWKNIMKSIKFSYMLIIPGVIGFLLLSKYILLIFGTDYSANAYGLLSMIAIAAIPLTLNMIYVSIMNARNNMRSVFTINFITTVLTIGITYFTLEHGLIMIGYAWLASQMLVAIPVFFKLRGLKND